MTDPVRALTQDEIKNRIKSDYERRVARHLKNNFARRIDIEYSNMASGFTEEAGRLILAPTLQHGPAGRMFQNAVNAILNTQGSKVEAILPDGTIKPLPSIIWNNEPRAVNCDDVFDVKVALWREIEAHQQNDWKDTMNNKGDKA